MGNTSAMHRSLTIAVPPEETDALLRDLEAFEEQVVSMSVDRGASVKPPGDVVSVQVLNRSVSPVMEAIAPSRCRLCLHHHLAGGEHQ